MHFTKNPIAFFIKSRIILNLGFKLSRLNLIEISLICKSPYNERRASVLASREKLINKVSNSFKLLLGLYITMSLLCFNFDPTEQ